MAGEWPRILVALVLLASAAAGCGRSEDVEDASADIPAATDAGAAGKGFTDATDSAAGSVAPQPPAKSRTRPSRVKPPRMDSTARSSRGTTGPAAAVSLVTRVDDPADDREGAAETSDYIDLTAASVSQDGRDVVFRLTAAAPIPEAPEGPNDLAIYAFDVETDATQWSLTAQITESGTTAELSGGDAKQSLDIAVRGATIRYFVPWRVLGPGEPTLSWTASSAYLTFQGGVASAKGGDAAPQTPASFPPGGTKT